MTRPPSGSGVPGRSHDRTCRLLGGLSLEIKLRLLLVIAFGMMKPLKEIPTSRFPLFRRFKVEPLSWDLHLKIPIGAARGLAILHTSEKKVIYRDFKASNILLDGVRSSSILSDFGLAKLEPSGSNSHIATRGMATYGYASPEYVEIGEHLFFRPYYMCLI
ncbi:hypothetical protein T459_23309 [Capsicum annuum]|uniref:Protein kinase domain-containing protein n=1 Tax=Capsicum annuum TaxID=4072 RepID=A0A2G2YS60_CAPAN|nr:hypothetical protein T459_23309 [Capsicum annuum]